jgi:hypothetical protein
MRDSSYETDTSRDVEVFLDPGSGPLFVGVVRAQSERVFRLDKPGLARVETIAQDHLKLIVRPMGPTLAFKSRVLRLRTGRVVEVRVAKDIQLTKISVY